MTTPAPFLSRHLGEYLLVAQLSEDALGTVFRALYAADERRFVRLRVLRSEELSAEAIGWAIRQRPPIDPMPAHDSVVARPQLGLADGIPFLCWDETAGWTLDIMLARVRAFGIRIPAEYALLIAERIAAALEHAERSASASDRLSGAHGLLWPGFVAISHDAAVRVGGFGIAEGILPSLGGTRLGSEIGPYAAPECRDSRRPSPNGDVYSLGAILVELLTGRRPSPEAPSAELRAGDPRSEELGEFLKRCLAPAGERFASAAEAHRALQQIVTGNPFSLYTANLALFLYKLLNPESQCAAPSSDWESTNPVVVRDLSATVAAESESAMPPALELSPGETPRRRREDFEPDDASLPVAVAAAVAVAVAAAPIAAGADRADDDAPEAVAEPPYPPRLQSAETSEPAIRRGLVRAWARPAATLATAAGVAVGAFLVASHIQSLRSGADLTTRAVAAAESLPASPAESRPEPRLPAPVPAPELVPASAPVSKAAPSAGAVAPPAGSTAASRRRPAAPVRKVRPELRRPAEELRLRAALARIEADRLDAGQAAPEVFVEGRSSEQEGERLLRERDYDAAQMAFSRAARLFQRAQEITWEERLRRSDLSSVR